MGEGIGICATVKRWWVMVIHLIISYNGNQHAGYVKPHYWGDDHS
jgi:hypothetical protein